MTRFRHRATYWLPGSFFAEDESRELPERTIEAAVAAAPEHAFAFKFYDTAICDFEFDAGLWRLYPIPQNESGKHYLGGEVFTCDALRALAIEEGKPDGYRVLIGNVTRWTADGLEEGQAIRCRTGNWQPFEAGDTLVDVGALALPRTDQTNTTEETP